MTPVGGLVLKQCVTGTHEVFETTIAYLLQLHLYRGSDHMRCENRHEFHLQTQGCHLATLHPCLLIDFQ